MTSEQLTKLKGMLRENEVPFFSDEEIELQFSMSENDLEMTAYELCIIKAENNALSLSGMSIKDTSDYWLRLATKYRPSNTVVL